MRRMYAPDFALGLLLFFVPFVLPAFGKGIDAAALISATAAIFAIVTGFFIADAMSNYLRLQTLIAEENASLIALADLVKRVDAAGAQKVHQAIDAYMIAQLDADTLNHMLITQTQLDTLVEAVDTLQVGPAGREFYDHILGLVEKIVASRQEMALAAKKNLTVVHWTTLIVLAALVAITTLLLRDGGLTMNLVAGTMIVGMQAVLTILRDVDNNRLLERKLMFENPREVFHAIARPPYYPAMSPARARLPDADGRYRLGTGKGIVTV